MFARYLFDNQNLNCIDYSEKKKLNKKKIKILSEIQKIRTAY